MQNYRKSSHATYDLKYHIVWITKYRKPVLVGRIAERTRELIRMVCKNNEVEILSGHCTKFSLKLKHLDAAMKFLAHKSYYPGCCKT